MTNYRLTQFSPGAGCGCKIAPEILKKIIAGTTRQSTDKNLIIGNDTSDDAAVYDLGNNMCIISTTDFFTPIVDNPYDFGRIAATNAISDIYAMGGNPFLAIAILGWPLDKLPAETAGEVLQGAKDVCSNAGVSLAGGHSIDISDPIFGLAVNGLVGKNEIKSNSGAKPGDLLFLTKPLGIGILTTAEKKGLVTEEHKNLAVELMCTLNKSGSVFGKLDYVHAMTDVTGFGLLGHLLEVCKGANLVAELSQEKVPVIDGIDFYIEHKTIPGGTFRNWKSYGNEIGGISERNKMVFCDPQTSGGLLIAVAPKNEQQFLNISEEQGFKLEPIGKLKEKSSSGPSIFIR